MATLYYPEQARDDFDPHLALIATYAVGADQDIQTPRVSKRGDRRMPRRVPQVLLSVPPFILAAASPLSATDAPRLVPKSGSARTYRFTISTERSGAPTVNGGGIYAAMISASTGSSATGTRRPVAGLMPKPAAAGSSGGIGCAAGWHMTIMPDYCSIRYPADVASKAEARSQYTLSYFILTATVTVTPQPDVAESAAQKTAVFKDPGIVTSNFLDCEPSELQKFIPLGSKETLDLACQRRSGTFINGLQRDNPAEPSRIRLTYRGKTSTTTLAGQFDTHIIDMDETTAKAELHATFYFSDRIGATVKYMHKIVGKTDVKFTVSSESELVKYEE
jgi:hypothetical protein